MDSTSEYSRETSKWPKKHKRELAAVLDNLDTFFSNLQSGVNPEQLKRNLSFVHGRYPIGILSIDESGAGGNAKPVRLYVFPHQGTEVLYLLRLRDKSSQSSDVQWCKNWVADLLGDGDE